MKRFISQRRLRGGKKMERKFKLDKNKVYMRIGQAVVYVTGCIACGIFLYWGFLQNTIY